MMDPSNNNSIISLSSLKIFYETAECILDFSWRKAWCIARVKSEKYHGTKIVLIELILSVVALIFSPIYIIFDPTKIQC